MYTVEASKLTNSIPKVGYLAPNPHLNRKNPGKPRSECGKILELVVLLMPVMTARLTMLITVLLTTVILTAAAAAAACRDGDDDGGKSQGASRGGEDNHEIASADEMLAETASRERMQKKLYVASNLRR